MALFGFSLELSDLISHTSSDDMHDLSALLEGVSFLAKANGKTHSHLCQDAIVIAYTKGKKDTFYLELGAYHSQKFSNTASL